MPNIDDVWANCTSFTASASDASRQLSFAGIAVIWIFKGGDANSIHLDRLVMSSAISLIVALAFDLLQYAVGYVCYYSLGRNWEKKIRENVYPANYEADYPDWINWPIEWLFRLKLIAVIVGYVSLFCYLLGKLN